MKKVHLFKRYMVSGEMSLCGLTRERNPQLVTVKKPTDGATCGKCMQIWRSLRAVMSNEEYLKSLEL